MGLLDDIQASALEDGAGLPGVLRRCLVLASILRHDPLRQWTNWELNGYVSAEDLPDYRRLSGIVKIDWWNIARQVTGEEVPYYYFPEEMHDSVRHTPIYFGVSALEALPKDEAAKLSVPPRVRYFVESDLVDDKVASVYFSVSPIAIAGILGAIRTRILEFTLSLAADFPEVNDARIGSNPVPQAELDRRFYAIIIHGDNNAITLGDHNITTAGTNNVVIKGDLNSLKDALREQGLDDEDLEDLEDLLKESFDADSLKRGEGRLGGWANSKAGKMARGGGILLKDFALNMIVALIMQYTYGSGGQSGKG